MDAERWKITAETAAIRGRGWLRLMVRLAGVAIVLVAAANLFGIELWTGYRGLLDARTVVGEPARGRIVFVADIVAMAVGAAVAHFV